MTTIAGLICGTNQDLYLDKAFKSLQGVDELFYMDGGSGDKSLEIAGCNGAVYLPAQSSGSECRNYAMETMTCDWLLWISPDDRLEDGAVEMLRKIASEVPAEVNAIDIWVHHIKGGAGSHLSTRMTRKGTRYYGRVHEIPVNGVYVAANVKVHHTAGPWHDTPTNPQAMIQALAADVAQYPNDPRWYYYLAREFFAQRDYGNALFWFDRRCEMAGSPGELADAYVHVSQIWAVLGNRDRAKRAAHEAFSINPNFKEAAARLAALNDDPAVKMAWVRIAEICTNAGVLVVRPV